MNSVREAYRQLLESVSKEICETVFFASGQANRITEGILNRFDVKPDFPWDEKTYQSYGVFRHENNRKWFALIMNVKRKTLLKNTVMSFVKQSYALTGDESTLSTWSNRIT